MKKHGLSRLPEYGAWRNMVARCTNPDHPKWPDYGGRGITVCDRWLNSFELFLADVGRRPGRGYWLDRFPNNDGNYEPGNVRWATPLEQGGNKRGVRLITYNGQTKHMAEWARDAGMLPETLSARLDRGLSMAQAMTLSFRESPASPPMSLLDWLRSDRDILEWRISNRSE